MQPLPFNLSQTQKSLIAEIEAAFAGVTREGGISWSEADAIDDYASPAERAAAREKDREKGWQDLVTDPTWPGSDVPSNWSFLDPIGYRYYLPAALIRAVMIEPVGGITPEIANRLTRRYVPMLKGLDARQIQTLERTAQFTIAVARRERNTWEERDWSEVLKTVDELRKRL